MSSTQQVFNVCDMDGLMDAWKDGQTDNWMMARKVNSTALSLTPESSIKQVLERALFLFDLKFKLILNVHLSWINASSGNFWKLHYRHAKLGGALRHLIRPAVSPSETGQGLCLNTSRGPSTSAQGQPSLGGDQRWVLPSWGQPALPCLKFRPCPFSSLWLWLLNLTEPVSLSAK